MAHKIRTYQDEVSTIVCDALDDGNMRPAIEMATGAGKSVTLAEVIKRRLTDGLRHLVFVDRREIVSQLYKEIYNHCGVKNKVGDCFIGKEMADDRCPRGARICVASMQSLTKSRAEQLIEWMTDKGTKPMYIHTDEGEIACTPTAQRVYELAGVNDGKSFHTIWSATLYRGDGKVLYEEGLDGKPAMLIRGKSGKATPAKPGECPAKRLVFQGDFVHFGELGWLVDPVLWDVPTNCDVSDIPMSDDGDFDEDKYAERINNWPRTNSLINAWKENCPDRQTIVFCASVQHAYDTAKYFRDAGFTAEAVDGAMDDDLRDEVFSRYKARKTRVLCNYKLVEKGIDIPECSCIVWLRQTKSRRVIVQGTGRGLRPLAGLLNDYNDATPEERKAVIAASSKPNCYVLCAVDIGAVDVRSAQELVGLPSTMRMQGQSLLQAKKAVDEYLKKSKRSLSDCPFKFQELEVIMRRIEELKSVRINQNNWTGTDTGYRFTAVPPGYTAHITITESGRKLSITCDGKPLFDANITGKWGAAPLKELLHKCHTVVTEKVRTHLQANPREYVREHRNKDGTPAKPLTDNQINLLVYKGGYSREEIARSHPGRWRKLIPEVMSGRHRKQESHS